jgi:hypothetical protein
MTSIYSHLASYRRDRKPFDAGWQIKARGFAQTPSHCIKRTRPEAADRDALTQVIDIGQIANW